MNEIEENNKIIAEFMGGILVDKIFPNDRQIIRFPEQRGYYLDSLEYHSDWSWLMPVVEKIEAIHHVYDLSYINVIISKGYVEIEGTKWQRIFKNTSNEGSKIKATWLAVIEFINWYNKNKQSPG